MLSSVLDFLLWLQPAGTSPAAGGAGDAGGAGSAGGCAMMSQPILMFAVLMALLYFTSIRPQRKRELEHSEMLKKLQKGDVVRTDGGIRGEIVKIGDQDAELLIAEKTKINILRSRIASVIKGDETGEAAKEKAG